ncbi:MAG: hypothetical protein DLM72_21190 [Candidatus Nitrosopolaris wilkensis]|nr:MAG: hypothetical protein DLM72_21190 [Candidatus Nitrosopolaris wilkensis]
MDYPNRADRVSLLDEGIKVLKSLWSKPNVNFSGKYFKINGASLKNPKESIPITVAAKGQRMMKIAAKHADIWESSYLSSGHFASLKLKFEEISSYGYSEGVYWKQLKLTYHQIRTLTKLTYRSIWTWTSGLSGC